MNSTIIKGGLNMELYNKDKMNAKVDLHMHTTYSDGNITMEELLEEILEKDISVFSITEHDTTENTIKALKFAETNNLCFIPGVEVTSTLEGRRHILGYGIDYNDDKLNKLMAKNRVLLQSGCDENKLLFPSPEEVITAIIDASGVPVIAHPGCAFYDRDYKRIVKLMLEFGVKGIECYHPENSKEITDYCLQICTENDLLITGGSDYHGSCVPHRKLGVPNIKLSNLKLKNLI